MRRRHAIDMPCYVLVVRLLFVLLLSACAADEQHEITEPGPLLTEAGRLREAGWSPRQLLTYEAARVADPARLRQWDFFTVLDERQAINVTLADMGWIRLCSVGAVDFATGEVTQTMVVNKDVALSTGLEGKGTCTVDGVVVMEQVTDGDGSDVRFDLQDPLFGPAGTGTLAIRRRPEMPYLSLAMPFPGDPVGFFYEQKVPGMAAGGSVVLGDKTFTFDAATAVMDWGRGVWPAKPTWHWAAGSGVVDGEPLSFNLGNGFGDDGAATENIVVYGDVPYKLGRVAWSYDADDPMQPWTFEGDGISLVLTPSAHEVGGPEFGPRYFLVHKGYGRLSGTVELAGKTHAIDGLLGFAEHVEVSW